jgi:hypothetical protein
VGTILDTYSPTVSTLAHSVLHQIAVMDGMETCLMDTVAAYLNQAYPEDATPLYLQLPRAVAEVCGLDPNQVYRIKKTYGLPDAGSTISPTVSIYCKMATLRLLPIPTCSCDSPTLRLLTFGST